MRAQHGSSSDPDPGASPSLPAEWAIDTDALNAAALGLLVDEPGASADAGDSAIFARNLEAIALRSPRIAKRLSDAAPRRDITFVDTADEVPSATLASPSGVIALASKRRPLAEAGTIAESVDIEDHGGIVVLGFALGYHARAIAERIGKHGVVIVYEPDLALLRAVLERVDHSDWIRETATCFLCDENASGEMSALTKGLEAPLSIGIELVEHAPSRARLGDRAAVFGSTFAEVVNAMRTQVITTLMQSDVTLRNVLMNAEHYVKRPGIADLKDAAKGRAAVVVSAGPSLERNLHLLADQEFRSRVVVIAVQTVLRPMLSAGVRPDFVTALDYHEISTRFYEGLTRDDLQGITLVAEPKVNPAVLDAFPGDIRLVTDEVLEQVFGPTRTPDDALTPGATVAHLAYYLARHLGCDPAILIGQDLGFTDGQYYASGAAIHDVWAPELNAFRTIEMFEWERIARGKTKLIERTDHLGRPIYTDQQMATYLAQFEREFSADVDAGRTIIDATEGGVAKRGTTASTLAEALKQHAAADRSPIEPPPVSTASRERPPELRGTLETIRSGSRAIARNSRETQKLLRRIADLQDKPGSTDRINSFVRQIHTIRDEVTKTEPAYSLVQRLNQTGTFQRFKSDRLLRLNPPTTEIERQKRQVERDALNVGWIAQMAEVLEELAGATIDSLDGAPKQTRPRPISTDDTDARSEPRRITTAAVVTTDTPERIEALPRTLERLAGCTRIAEVIVLTSNTGAVADACARCPIPTEPVELTPDPVEQAWQRRIQRARLWSRSCWRGGLAGSSCYDEALRLEATSQLLARRNVDAALVVDAVATALDPALCDELIDRHAESPGDRPLVFSQAAPGHAGCVVSRDGLERLAEMRARNSHFATLGGILSYVPSAAASDPIAADTCVKIAPTLRDADPVVSGGMTTLTVEFTGAPTNARGGERRSWFAPTTAREPITLEALRSVIDRAHTGTPFALTIAARGGSSVGGDPIAHPRFVEFMSQLNDDPRIGAIHLRTDLASDLSDEQLRAIASADVVSIDLLAQTEATYARISGNDCSLQSVLDNAQRLNQIYQSERIEGPLGVKGPTERWIVPRITRCDSTYDEIEGFYDHWLSVLGHAVIDPLPNPVDGQRISPLRIPDLARARLAQRRFDCAGSEL